ncbi:MAG: hypothetical protein BWY68_00667 [bacterium ADurb.Bin400]|nr:MAG: hypothetical protein BWY68_00667 [bacterium ADurb.Bin400]
MFRSPSAFINNSVSARRRILYDSNNSLHEIWLVTNLASAIVAFAEPLIPETMSPLL